MLATIWSLFVTGIVLGSGPCLLSCGPLLLTYVASTKTGWASALKTYAIFCGVRLAVYAAFGAGAGMIGAWVVHHLLESASLAVLYVAFGAFLVLLGLFFILEDLLPEPWRAALRCCHQGRGDLRNVAVFALIVSLAPCAPLLGLFGYIALLSDTWQKGAVFMAAFGLGTVISPMIVLMFLTGWFGSWLQRHCLVLRLVRAASGLIFMLLGGRLIWGAWPAGGNA